MTAYSPDPRDLGPEAQRAGPPVSRAESAADALARAARYSAWDGSQEMADLAAGELLRALADDVMAEGDLAEALRRLMERGWRTGDPTRGDMAGLRDLVDRLERRREQMLERYLIKNAKVQLNAGHTYGKGSDNHMRMNVATSRRTLELALNNLAGALTKTSSM